MTGPKLLTAEEGFCACLMWLPPADALKLHGLLRPEDFESPRAAEVHRLIGGLARKGVQPNALAVYLAAVSEEAVLTASTRHELTDYVTRLYGDPNVTPANAAFFATRALEATLRRRTTEMAVRLQQIADTADIDELERMTLVEHAALQQLRQRFHALAGVPTLHVREVAA